MNTKKVPLFIMLLGAAVACIVTYIDHYNLHDTLVVLIIVLILFLIIGIIVKKLLDKFEISIDDTVDDEGEVVEKSGEGEGGLEGEAAEPSEDGMPAGVEEVPEGGQTAAEGEP